jgi:hypothetical protein
MHGSPARRPIATWLALLLSLQGLVGAFARLEAAAPIGLEICTGDGGVRSVAGLDQPPFEPDRPGCVLCLLPTVLAAADPAALPLLTAWSIDRPPPSEERGGAPAVPRPSWPRAPPRS